MKEKVNAIIRTMLGFKNTFTPLLLNFLRKARRRYRKLSNIFLKKIKTVLFLIKQLFLTSIIPKIKLSTGRELLRIKKVTKITDVRIKGTVSRFVSGIANFIRKTSIKLRKIRITGKALRSKEVLHILRQRTTERFWKVRKCSDSLFLNFRQGKFDVKNITKRFKRIVSKIKFRQLPHIYRIITAKKNRSAVLTGLILLLIYNLLPSPTPSSSLINFNDSPMSHYLLGENFLTKNNYQNALDEFMIAGLRSKNQLLTDGRIEEANNLLTEKERLEDKVNYWEQLIGNKPNYRDGYLQLAILSYQLNRPLTGKEYWQKAFELDPNYKITKDLAAIFQSFLSGF